MKTRVNFKQVIFFMGCGLLSLNLSYGQAIPPSTFKHEANSGNTTNNYTTIDNAATNSRAEKILFVTHDYGSGGPYVASPLGVWYQGGKWKIFKQDRQPMPSGAKFNVLSQTLADRGVFIHTAQRSSISGHITTIDNAATNNNPDAKLVVTQNYGTSGPYNNNPIGVYYDSGRWKIYNQNRAAMPVNAKFNIIANHSRAFRHTASSSSTSHITSLDNSSTNNSPNAFVFATQLWEGVYNPHSVGVWYSANKWKIYNEDRVRMPASSKFNVIAFSLGGSPGPDNPVVRILKRDFVNILNPFLSTLSMKLNNHGARHRDSHGDVSWYAANDSHIGLGSYRLDFDIPEYTRGLRDKKHYVNDINLTSARANFEGRELHATLVFEEDGSELKGYCSNCAKFREDRATPDYQLNDNRWDVQFRLVPYEGSITLEVVYVNYLGSVDGSVFGELFEGIVQRQVIPKMERAFRDSFNAQRGYIAQEIRRLAAARGINLDLSSIRVDYH